MNLFGLSGILTGLTSSAFALIVILHGPKITFNRIWACFCITVAIWGFGSYQVSLMQSPEAALFWWRIVHVGIIFIPVLFIHFSYEFLDIKEKLSLYIVYGIGVFFLITNTTPYFIGNVKYVFNEFYYDSPPGIFYYLFFAFFAGSIVYAHFLFRKRYKSLSIERKAQLKYFVAGTIIGFVGGTTAFLPVFGINLYPWGNFAVPLYPIIMSYGIVRYRLFDVKVAAIELLTILTWGLLFFRLFIIGDKTTIIIDSFIFGAVVILGIAIIRLALREIIQREELKDLNLHLENKVREQTQEIRQAYGVEKKARHELEELDKAKTDFILTTQHHLRTPLTVVKGMVQIVLSRKKELPEDIVHYLDKADENTNKLAKLVNDFLDISQMEVGKSILNKQPTSIHPLIDEAITEVSHEIEQKQLKVEATYTEEAKETTVSIDKKRLIDALTNLIDNAVKYTPKSGRITIHGEIAIHPIEKTKMYRLTITDTGIGMTDEEQEKIFKRSFERGSIAKEMNATGRGIGLMLTKQIVEAHGGVIHAESLGRDTGSVFVVEIPV